MPDLLPRNEALDRPIRKFNPGTLQSDAEVVRQFVVRQRELNLVLEILRGNSDSPSCQHLLIVGSRGLGKTMLLARVSAELRTNSALSGRLFPVRFMEESHEIFTLADFWYEALFYFANATENDSPEFSQELRATHAELTDRWRDTSIEDYARNAVLEAADRLGKKLVLMVENLQGLFSSVDKDFGWKLRQTLQSEPQVMLLATATSRFKGLDDARQPYFEQFRIINLEPLDTDSCRRIWNMASDDKQTNREIKPLQILTGGNPRLLIIVATFSRHRSLRQLLEDLVALIDDHTEYFRNHLDGLAKTERRVYLAVIDLWQLSSAQEIAARARMDIRTVSAMIGRLVDRGAVLMEGTGRKRTYVAAERLYSIYYKLRRERDEADLVRNLIQFMTVYYRGDELAEMAGRWRIETAQSPSIRKGLERALAASGVLDLQMEVAKALFDKGRAHGQRGESDAELAAYGDLVTRFADSDIPDLQVQVAKALFNKGRAHGQRGESDAELAAYGDLVTRFADSDAPDLQVHVAKALFNKGVTHGERGEPDAELAAYSDLVTRFGGGDISDLREPVARALFNKGVTHGQRGESDAELAAYDNLVIRFGDTGVLELQIEVAKALIGKGMTFGRRGESDAELAAYDDLVTCFGDSDIPDLQVPVARALFSKGVTHGRRGESDAELAAYDDLVRRFGDSDIPDLQEPVARALLLKGVTHGRRGESDTELAAYDDLFTRFGDSDIPDLHEPVARALLFKGVTHGRRGESDAELAAYDDLVRRFGDSDIPDLQEPVARALVNRGVTHGQRGESDAELAAYDDLFTRFGDSDIPGLQVPVANALLFKGFAHGQRGESDAELAAYDDLVRRFGESDIPRLQVPVTNALLFRGLAHGQRGESDMELAAYNDLVARFGDNDTPELQEQVAKALVNKGIAYGRRGKSDAELAAYDDLIARFGDSDVLNLQEQVGNALLFKGLTHHQRSESDEGLAAYDDLVAGIGDSDIPDLQVQVAKALLFKGDLQLSVGRAEEALCTINRLERRFVASSDNETSAIGLLLWRGKLIRTHALTIQEKHTEALDVFQSVCAMFVFADEPMLSDMLERVPALIASGASEADLAKVLSAHSNTATALTPLVVALRLLAGESVRAPDEVREVANDIRSEIEEAKRRGVG